MDFMNWLKYRLIPWFTSLGITTRTVTLEVVGRKTGRKIKVSLSRTDCNGQKHFVSLGGESEWVRNVRAAGGKAVILSRGRREIVLEETPLEERAPVLWQYVQSRAFTHSGSQSARHFFGLSSHPTLEDMKSIAERFIVFRINQNQQR